jgi:hypothetical protein
MYEETKRLSATVPTSSLQPGRGRGPLVKVRSRGRRETTYIGPVAVAGSADSRPSRLDRSRLLRWTSMACRSRALAHPPETADIGRGRQTERQRRTLWGHACRRSARCRERRRCRSRWTESSPSAPVRGRTAVRLGSLISTASAENSVALTIDIDVHRPKIVLMWGRTGRRQRSFRTRLCQFWATTLKGALCTLPSATGSG